jgi:peptide/nickel transport system permease protein
VRSYVLRRLATSVGLLVLSSVLIFVVLRLIPGDPTIIALAQTPEGADPHALQTIRHNLGLDHSLLYQYWHWVTGIFHGDFGKSYFSGFKVTTLLGERAPATVELATCALLLGLLIAVPAATIGAIWRNRFYDRLLSGFTAIGMSTPSFISGILLILLFGVKLKLLPIQGYVSITNYPIDSLKTTILPASTLALAIAAPIIRLLRSSLADVASAPYMRTAQGKGLRRHQVVVRHLLPNALIPALTMVGVIVGGLIGGSVIVEYVFARRGLGALMIQAVEQRDYQVLQALVLLAAATFIMTSLVTDLLYGLIDPRLRVRQRQV